MSPIRLDDLSVTFTPPAGAAPSSVTVPVALDPALIAVEGKLRDLTCTAMTAKAIFFPWCRRRAWP